MLKSAYNSASETYRDRIIDIFKKLNDFIHKYYNKNITLSLNRKFVTYKLRVAKNFIQCKSI